MGLIFTVIGFLITAFIGVYLICAAITITVWLLTRIWFWAAFFVSPFVANAVIGYLHSH